MVRVVWRPWACGVALVMLARPLAGQDVRTMVDLGMARVRYEDTTASQAASVSPSLSILWPRAQVGMWGSGAQFSGAITTFSGGLGAALQTPTVHALTGEVAANGGGSIRQDGERTAEYRWLARGRLAGRVNDTYLGGSLGGGTGRTWDGTQWRTLTFGEGLAWLSHGAYGAQLRVTPSAIQSGSRYTDTDGLVTAQFDRLDLEGSVGLRRGEMAPFVGQSREWGGASATLWMNSVAGFVVAAGTYPASLTQALPGGRYMFVALRISTYHRSRIAQRVAASQSAAAVNRQNDVPEMQIVRVQGNTYDIRVHAVHAQSIEFMSDATLWRVVPLESDEPTWWHLTVTLAPGAHQCNIRVDGGSWIAPRGLLAAADEFGGTVGVFEVP